MFLFVFFAFLFVVSEKSLLTFVFDRTRSGIKTITLMRDQTTEQHGDALHKM